MKKRFTDNEIKLVNETNILTLAQSKGYDITKISGKSYKIPDYGGLYIRADGMKWNWFSKGTGGGPIQFLMELEGLTWVDAVKDILGINYDAFPIREKPLKNIEENIEFVLPKKNDTYKHIFAYLIKTRKIDHQIVQKFVTEKKYMKMNIVTLYLLDMMKTLQSLLQLEEQDLKDLEWILEAQIKDFLLYHQEVIIPY